MIIDLKTKKELQTDPLDNIPSGEQITSILENTSFSVRSDGILIIAEKDDAGNDITIDKAKIKADLGIQ